LIFLKYIWLFQKYGSNKSRNAMMCGLVLSKHRDAIAKMRQQNLFLYFWPLLVTPMA
jgi:hypothetical protein